MKWLLNYVSTDSRGNPSKTWPLVLFLTFVVVTKFVLAGLKLPHLGQVPGMSAGEFSAAISPILAAWWAREHTSKTLEGISPGATQ